VVEQTGLTKDVVSKFVTSLIEAKPALLLQDRESNNLRVKRLRTTDAGKELLEKIRDSLQQPRQTTASNHPPKPVCHNLFDDVE
jgi:DNA-binding MarR family transcriptional regulator